MSAKNKRYRKKTRQEDRYRKGRQPRSDVSATVLREIATRILTNPKANVCARVRRKLTRQRGRVVEVPRKQATHPAVKLALRLQKLSLATLYRRLKQSARRASTCKHLLSELSKDSHFAPPIIAQHTHQLGMHKQIKAEIKFRTPSLNIC